MLRIKKNGKQGQDATLTEHPADAKIHKHQSLYVWGLVFFLLFVDQASKIAVKLSMYLGEEIHITNWFSILFVENPGMAFGLQLGSKLLLTLFRIVVMTLLAIFIYKLLKTKLFKTGYLLTLALIFAGGVGNIFDSIFYGVLFSDSVYNGPIATFLPQGGGYAPLLHGKVVDMLYFPLIDTHLPQWVPFFGGQHFTFFDPVFNFADSCVSVGAVLLLFFYIKSFSRSLEIFSAKPEEE